MNKLKYWFVSFSFFAAFLFGVWCGHLKSQQSNDNNVSQLVIMESCSDITDTVNTLRLIKSGRVNELIEEKEYSLESEIMALARTLDDEVLLLGKPLQALQKAYDYRQSYPFAMSQTNWDERIDYLLKRVSELSRTNVHFSQ